MNYFSTSVGLKPTGMTPAQLFEYISEGELSRGKREAIRLFKELIASPYVLFREKGQPFIYLQIEQKDWVTGGSDIPSMMRVLHKQVENGRYIIIHDLETDQFGDSLKFVAIPKAQLNSAFRKQILDDLLPTI